MAHVLLVNPKRRRKRNASRRRKHHTRRARRRTRHVVAVNPHRRRRRRNPAFRFHRKRRRNPSFSTGGFVGQLKSGASAGLTGALGALGLDLLWGYTNGFLPSMLQNTFGMYLSKAVGAVLVGIVGSKVLPGKAHDLTRGAMTVVIHDALKSTLQGVMPSLPLGSYVGTSPLVAYGAPALHPQIGVPTAGIGLRTSSGPSAHQMGVYTSMQGFIDGADGTEWG